jgi:excisionase family DNA binding protein
VAHIIDSEKAARRGAFTLGTAVPMLASLPCLTIDHLRQGYLSLEKDVAPSTWLAFGEDDLEEKLKKLHDKIHRVPPTKRTRLEDRIVQATITMILKAICEEFFPGLPHGLDQAERRSYSVEEIAARNRLSRAFIYEQIKDRKLRARKAGARTRVTDDDETAWLNAMPEAPATIARGEAVPPAEVSEV